MLDNLLQDFSMSTFGTYYWGFEYLEIIAFVGYLEISLVPPATLENVDPNLVKGPQIWRNPASAAVKDSGISPPKLTELSARL